MQYAEFRKYLQERNLPDDWWISLDGEVQSSTTSLDSAFGMKRSRPDRQIQLSNGQEQDRQPIPWHPLDMSAEQPAAAPAAPQYQQPATPYQQPYPQQSPTGYAPQTMVNTPPQGTQTQGYPQQAYGGGGGGSGGSSAHMKMMLIGLVIIMGSWTVKQLFASLAAYGLGGAMSEMTVEARRGAEVASQTVDDRLEMYEEQQKDNSDSKRISELKEDINKAKREVDEDYGADLIESEADSASGESLAASMARWFLKSKILLDIAKLVGIFMIVVGAFRVLQDPYASPHNRWFAIISASIILFSVMAAGLASLLA